MKKKKIVIVSISTICSLILICAVVLIPFLLKKKKSNNDVLSTISAINLNYITNLEMDLTNAISIGISKNLSTTSQASSVVMNVNDSNKKANSKYYLYSTKNNGNKDYFEKIKFKKHSSINENIYNDKNELIENDITQDEINAQINKLYITEDFTFIQFIPIIEQSGTYEFLDENNKSHKRTISLRPNELIYDENGVSEFDKVNYFSDEFTQSFVISNKTNNIYKIENFIISAIKDGLVKDNNGLIYSVSIDNNNLKFTNLFNNPNITVKDYYQDKFGNNYIKNTTVNEIDVSTRTIFYTDGYYRAKDNTVIKISGEFVYDVQSSQIDKLNITDVKKIGENLSILNITTEDRFDFNNQRIAGEYYDSWNKLSKIENGIVYLYGASVSSKVLFTTYDILNHNQKEYFLNCEYIYPIDYNTIIYFNNEKNKVGNVYYLIMDFNNSKTTLYKNDIESQATLLLSNCMWNYQFISNEECQWNNFSIDTINARKEYIIVKNESGNVEAKLISDYYSQENKVIIFQPLKKDN